MATQGTVTITARVNASQAEQALKSLGGAANRIAVDYRSASQQQMKAASDSFELRKRLDDQMARSTMSSSEYRIRAIKMEAEETDRTIRQMALSRKQQEDLVYRNVASMEAQITAIMKAEAEKRKKLSIAGMEVNQPDEGSGLGTVVALGSRIGRAGLIAGTVAVGVGMMSKEVQSHFGPMTEAASRFEEKMQAVQIISEKTSKSFENAFATIEMFDDGISSMTSVGEAVGYLQTMNMSVDEQRKLIGLLRDGLTAMGKSVNDNLPLMALAVKRGESALFDKMGVMTNAEQMVQRYARSIGKSTQELTQQERELAILKGVMKDLSIYEGTAIADSQDYAGSKQRLATATEKLNRAMGDLFLPTLKTVNNWMADLVGNTAKAVDKLSDLNAEMVKGASEGSAGRFAMPGQVPLFTPPKIPTPLMSNILAGPGYGPDSEAPLRRAELDAAAKADEDAQKRADEARQRAEDAQKEAEREAKRIASEQTSLREQLNRDLALINLEGFDRERAQAMQAHHERLKQAHGNAELMKQSRELYFREIAKIDAAATKKQSDDAQRQADEIGQRIERETMAYVQKQRADAKAVEDLQKSEQDAIRSGITSGIQAGLDGGLPNLIGSFETASKSALTKGIVTAIESSPAMGAMGQLGAAFANPFVAAFGLAFTAGLNQFLQERQNWETLRDRYITKESERPQWRRDLDSVNEKRAGIETRIGQLNQTIKDEQAHFIDRQNAERERTSLLQQITKTEELTAAINREAANKQLEAAQQAAGVSARSYYDQYNELTRKADQDKRLAEACQQGPDAVDRVEKEIRAENYRHDSLETMRGLGVDLAGSFGNDVDLKGLFGNDLVKALEDGVLDPSEKLDFTKYFGEQRDAGFQELDKLAGLFQQMLANDPANRVLPGSSPQNPNYTIMLNAKDIWSSMPKDAWLRATGPGTRRDDGGSGRGINVGGRR